MIGEYMSKKTRNLIRHYLRGEDGVVAIEFSMVFIPFIISVLFIIEMSRVVFVSSAMDLIIAESGHLASITRAPEKYQLYFNEEINKRMTSWPLISSDVKVKVSVVWCADLAEIIKNNCNATDARNRPLAMYGVVTDYQPLFLFFPIKSIVHELSRKVLFVQEFQRESEDEK